MSVYKSEEWYYCIITSEFIPLISCPAPRLVSSCYYPDRPLSSPACQSRPLNSQHFWRELGPLRARTDQNIKICNKKQPPDRESIICLLNLPIDFAFVYIFHIYYNQDAIARSSDRSRKKIKLLRRFAKIRVLPQSVAPLLVGFPSIFKFLCFTIKFTSISTAAWSIQPLLYLSLVSPYSVISELALVL